MPFGVWAEGCSNLLELTVRAGGFVFHDLSVSEPGSFKEEGLKGARKSSFRVASLLPSLSRV